MEQWKTITQKKAVWNSKFFKSKRSREICRTGLDNRDNIIECSPTPAGKEHDHKVNIEGSCARLLPSIICRKFEGKNITILELKQEVTVKKNKVKDAIKKIDELQNPSKRKNRFSIPEVKDSKRFAMFYTSLQNHGAFMWIYNRIHKKVEKL